MVLRARGIRQKMDKERGWERTFNSECKNASSTVGAIFPTKTVVCTVLTGLLAIVLVVVVVVVDTVGVRFMGVAVAVGGFCRTGEGTGIGKGNRVGGVGRGNTAGAIGGPPYGIGTGNIPGIGYGIGGGIIPNPSR